MAKISLLDAKSRIANMDIVDVFSSYLRKTQVEDAEAISEQKKLFNKIREADKYFKLDDIKHQLDLLRIEQAYYAPDNAMFYYKDNVPEEFQLQNLEVYKQITKEVRALETKINEISEHIYIEV